jgi:hypothetical protein
VVKASKTRSANFRTVLAPAWKWLVAKNTELNPWKTLPGLYRDSGRASIPEGNPTAILQACDFSGVRSSNEGQYKIERNRSVGSKS